MEKLTYGTDVEVDFSSLPDASQHALAQRGFTHLLGNEIASKVHAWAGQEGQANSDDKAAVKTWKEANAKAVTDKSTALVADMLKALTDGTVGARVGGPRLAPLDTIRRRIAKEQVVTILAGNGIKTPKKDETIKFPDGREVTLESLIDDRLVKVLADGRDIGAEITKAAEKELAQKAKALEAAKAKAKDSFGEL